MNKRNILLSLSVILLFSFYLPVNRPYGEVGTFKTFIDDLIPLSTIFVVPYISYFVFLLFTWGYFIRSKKSLKMSQTLLGISIATILAYIFYFFFQNSIERPSIQSQNIFDTTYLWINSQVAEYNAFPSLHVAISTVCLLGYREIKTKIYHWMMIWVLLIIVSTVLTKQHYFLDIVGGLILAWASFNLSKYVIRK